MTINTNLVFVTAAFVACMLALAAQVGPQLGVHGLGQLGAPGALVFESRPDGSRAEPGDGLSREAYGPMAALGSSGLPF